MATSNAKSKTTATAPKYHATVDVHYQLFIALNAQDLDGAVAEAKALNAIKLWNGETPVQDIFDNTIQVNGLSGPTVSLKE